MYHTIPYRSGGQTSVQNQLNSAQVKYVYIRAAMHTHNPEFAIVAQTGQNKGKERKLRRRLNTSCINLGKGGTLVGSTIRQPPT